MCICASNLLFAVKKNSSGTLSPSISHSAIGLSIPLALYVSLPGTVCQEYAFIAVAFCSMIVLYALYAAFLFFACCSVTFFGLGGFFSSFLGDFLLQPAIDKMSNADSKIAIADLSLILVFMVFLLLVLALLCANAM